tara:strand:+ start:514 stop:735 length:222 start_codon:yes stop_codon:yes gene_type:complete
LGLFDGKPKESDCAECDQYIGPPRGAGDYLAGFIDTIGVGGIAKTIRKKSGKDCGCGKRRRALNEKFPKKEED